MATRTDDDVRDADLREEAAPPPPPDSARTAEQVTVEREEEPRRSSGRVLDTFRFLLAGALLAVLVMFAVANDTSAEIDYIVATDTVPLVWPLAGAMAGGALLALLLRRHR